MILRCPILLNLTLTPGRKDSPDGPARDVTIRCRWLVGHRILGVPHSFPIPKAAP